VGESVILEIIWNGPMSGFLKGSRKTRDFTRYKETYMMVYELF